VQKALGKLKQELWHGSRNDFRLVGLKYTDIEECDELRNLVFQSPYFASTFFLSTLSTP